MKLTISLLASIVLIIILSACSSVMGIPTDDETPEVTTSTPVRDENIVVVTPVYDGPNQVNLSIGQVLVVQIPTIPQEGYKWMLLDYDSSVLAPEGEGAYIEDTDPDSAGGVAEFRFVVVGKGECSLNFDYRNEDEGVSSNTYGLMVTVSDSSQNFVVVTPDPTGP